MNIAVIIPVFNEAENIEKTLDALAGGIARSDAAFAVFIVYDLDADTTLPVLDRISSRYQFPVQRIKNPGRGVCNAIKSGLKQAPGDFFLVSMADMSDDYAALPAMVRSARGGSHVVCASRYMKGGRLYGGPFIKQMLSRLAGLSLHWLTRIPTHDITNSYRLYSREIVDRITIESSAGFELGMEITIKAYLLGYRITEVPARWWDRAAGQSRFKLMAWIPRYLKWYCFLLCAPKTGRRL